MNRINENILWTVAEFLVMFFFTGLFALIANIARDFGFFNSPIVFIMAICFLMTSLFVSYSRKGNWV